MPLKFYVLIININYLNNKNNSQKRLIVVQG
jgi:hypothetical protein